MAAEKAPITVAITGAAGNIGYALIPLVASGRVFGPSQRVVLHLIDIPRAADALRGVQLEITDCAYPLLAEVRGFVEAEPGFAGVQYAFLVGGFPRLKGMVRADLIEKNAAIFVEQGRAIEAAADRDVKVLVVANPANTNALIAASHAPSIPKANFTAMTRLDQNRAAAQVALKLGVPVSDVTGVAVWGNHSKTMYADVAHGACAGRKLSDALAGDDAWVKGEFLATVQGRGAEIIAARGLSSAMSAANAAADHMREWVAGTPDGTVSSMAVWSNGNPYGVPDGLVYSFPVRCAGGKWEFVAGIELTDWEREQLKANADELAAERDAATKK